MKRKLLIATHNKGKLQLFKNYLASLDYDILSLDDVGITYDVEETGLTYEENARKKAEAYSEISGLLTLAEDVGLEIYALGGDQGIY
ncbi:MAG: non-canonical purine NTP pyrophosphatase, partial [Candidatus Babeliales bacterium]